MPTAKDPKPKPLSRRTWSDEEVADISELRKTKSNGQIAAMYADVTAGQIQYVIRKAGLTKKQRVWSDEEVADIIKAYKTKSTVQIADMYDSNYDAIRRLLQKNNVKLRDFKEANEIVLRYATAGDLNGLAADLGIDAGALHDLMVKRGFLPDPAARDGA